MDEKQENQSTSRQKELEANGVDVTKNVTTEKEDQGKELQLQAKTHAATTTTEEKIGNTRVCHDQYALACRSFARSSIGLRVRKKRSCEGENIGRKKSERNN